MKTIFSVLSFLLLFTSCDVYYIKAKDDAEVVELKHFQEYRILCEKELATLPDFSCKQKEAPIFEPSLSNVTWLTVETVPFGSENAKQGGQLFYRINEFPATFRYYGPNADSTSKSLFGTQMPLLDISPYDKSFIPCAARAWAFSDDGKTVYYKLNENAKWSNGMPCTADDFEFAIKFFTSKSIVDPWVNESFEDITVTKLSDFLIAVTCEYGEHLSKSELLSVTNLTPVCKEFYSGNIPVNWVYEYNNIAEPTTGPYYLASYDMNTGLNFVKVDNWWGHEYPHYKYFANFDSISFFLVLGKEKEGLKHFKAAKFDLLELENYASYLSALDEACVNDGYVTVWHTSIDPLIGMDGFFFNCNDKYLKDKTLRQALFYALDLDTIGQTSPLADYARLTTLGRGQVFDGVSFNNETLKPIHFDIKTANELLDKTDFATMDNGVRVNSKGEKLTLKISYSKELSKAIFGILSEQAKKAGIALTFSFIKEDVAAIISKGDFQIYFGSLPVGQLPNHYYNFHSSFANTNDLNNIVALQDHKLDELLETYTEYTTDLQGLATLNKEIEKAVMENYVFLPYYYTEGFSFLTWKWICFPSWINHKQDINFAKTLFTYAWFDQAIYDEVVEARKNGQKVQTTVFNRVR